jgi:hypothetical protein
LRQVLDDYLRMRSSLAERSKESYRALVERHLADWLDRELKSIKPEDVETKHRAIKESVEARYRAMKASAEARGLDLSLLKISTGLREAGDFDEPAVPSRSW